MSAAKTSEISKNRVKKAIPAILDFMALLFLLIISALR
jgi:hypothetical protein